MIFQLTGTGMEVKPSHLTGTEIGTAQKEKN